MSIFIIKKKLNKQYIDFKTARKATNNKYKINVKSLSNVHMKQCLTPTLGYHVVYFEKQISISI